MHLHWEKERYILKKAIANKLTRYVKSISYGIRLAWQVDKSIFLNLSFYALLNAAQPILLVMAPKLILDELSGNRRIEVFAVILIFLLIGLIACAFGSEYSLGRYYPKERSFRLTLQHKLDEKCMKMQFSHTEDPNALDRLEAARNAIYAWGDGLAVIPQELFRVISAVVTVLGYIWILFTLSPLIVLLLIVNVGVVCFFRARAKKKELEILPKIYKVCRECAYYESVMHDFEYGKDIRIFHIAEWLSNRAWGRKLLRIKLYKELMMARFLPEGADAVFLLLREGVSYAYLIYKFITVGMTVGNFSLYFSTISAFTRWMLQVVDGVVNLIGQSEYSDLYHEYMELSEEMETENPIAIPPGPYTIEFERVRFRYPHGSRDIYTDLSLKIPAGQKLAIVGINGAGKTTFVKLVTRLYDPTEGRILLNGIDIRRFDRSEYYRLLSIVFQDIHMFAFSLAENISLGLERDDERIWECLRQSSIDEKVCSLKNGLDTSVLRILDPKGIEFSGGENQRIALSRALYKGGPLVILDEPTAALDAIAENAIYQAFNSMVENKTAVYISHRLASTRFCDVIAFFENGEIIEYGSHDELMALKGKYEEMFSVQAHYYNEDVKGGESGEAEEVALNG